MLFSEYTVIYKHIVCVCLHVYQVALNLVDHSGAEVM